MCTLFLQLDIYQTTPVDITKPTLFNRSLKTELNGVLNVYETLYCNTYWYLNIRHCYWLWEMNY